MAVKLRMARIGRRHRPFFRINAVDGRTPRNGKVLEKIGHYDPIEKNIDKQIVLDTERIKYWLDKGAIPSEAVSDMLAKIGIKTKHGVQQKKKRLQAKKIARAGGKFFTKAEKNAAEKAAEKEAKQAEENAKAAAEKIKAEEKAKAAAEKTKAEEKAPQEKTENKQ